MKSKLSGLFAVTIFFASLASCNSSTEKTKGAPTNAPRAPSALPVEGYVVVPQAINPSLTIAGTLLPMEETAIHPEVSGRVVLLSVKEGAYITKGTVMAKLFDEDLRAQLQKLKVQLEVAQRTEERQSNLLRIGGISQQDYDLSLLNVSALKADIAVMESNIEKTVIRAPFNGTLGFKNISIGAYITPQTVITTIRQTDLLKLEFSVPEKFSPSVKVGNAVHFTTESNKGEFEARIMSTESSINQSTRSLDVHALVRNTGNRLKAGAFANILYHIGEETNAVMIPSQCIIPGAREKNVIVFNAGQAAFQVVETGIRSADKIEITKGLVIGDTVITTGLLSIKPGSSVRISSYYKEEDQ